MNEGKNFFALLRGGMGNIGKFLHISFAIIFLCVWTTIGFVAVLLAAIYVKIFRKVEKPDVWPIRYISKIWSVPLVWSLGLNVEVIGLDKLKHGTKYMFVSNHVSALDVILIPAKLPFLLRTMAKAELFKILPFGWAMKIVGVEKVNRDSGEKRRNAAKNLEEKAGTREYSNFMFPEGTRSRDGKLKKFYKSAFVAAITSKTPLVSITIIGAYEVLPPNNIWAFDRGRKITLVIGEPIETRKWHYDDRDRLIEKVMKEIEQNLSKYN